MSSGDVAGSCMVGIEFFLSYCELIVRENGIKNIPNFLCDGTFLANSDSSRALIKAVRDDRNKRQEVMGGIVIYEVNNGRMCISDRKTNKYLPNTMTPWETAVKWDFVHFSSIKTCWLYIIPFQVTPGFWDVLGCFCW